jgi:hypothetical protein
LEELFEYCNLIGCRIDDCINTPPAVSASQPVSDQSMLPISPFISTPFCFHTLFESGDGIMLTIEGMIHCHNIKQIIQEAR